MLPGEQMQLVFATVCYRPAPTRIFDFGSRNHTTAFPKRKACLPCVRPGPSERQARPADSHCHDDSFHFIPTPPTQPMCIACLLVCSAMGLPCLGASPLCDQPGGRRTRDCCSCFRPPGWLCSARVPLTPLLHCATQLRRRASISSTKCNKGGLYSGTRKVL